MVRPNPLAVYDGPNTRAKLQLAHPRCNRLKRDKPLAEARAEVADEKARGTLVSVLQASLDSQRDKK